MGNEPKIHERADVQTKKVGARSKIWQYVVVLSGAIIGEDCNICSHCFIENDVTVGNRVTVKNGVKLYDGVCIGDDVFIGPNVTFTNDHFPRSGNRGKPIKMTEIGKGASIGAGCVILPGILIGEGAMIGAGSIVTKDIAPNTLVVGNPARFVKNI